MKLENLEVEKWLEYNAKLQQKKNNLRKDLKEKGILKKEGTNNFDNYKYFSEGQYKELFTELFSKNGLELKTNELEYSMFEGTEKQANGRNVKLEFNLYDIETGFYETSIITGEGIDKGDKAGYKANTGAVKYYLADTFLVATGDDAEKESPDNKMNNKVEKKITPSQLKMLNDILTEEERTSIIEKWGELEQLTITQASQIIKKKNAQ